jgi:ribonuclease BN (tRNA processing enzyme)
MLRHTLLVLALVAGGAALAATAPQPAAQAPKPVAQTPTSAKPAGQASKPGGQAAKPAVPPAKPASQAAKPASPRPAARTELVLLGTGTPNAEPDRSGSAVAIVVDQVPYLIDAGPGVVRRASAAFARGVAGLEPKRLRMAFFTHLHSDHTAGYPDLILTPAVLERDAPLVVYGPKGTRDMTSHILSAYSVDIDVRTHDLEPSKPAGYVVRATDIEAAGTIYGDERVAVTAVPVRHGAFKHAYAYRFVTPDRTIVISGDTAPTDAIVDACNGCDILVHEVYSTAGFAKRPPEWQRYHKAYHTSSADLGALATRARPKLLVLYHQLYWGVADEALVAEIRQVYTGKVVSGKDLDVF